MRPGDRVTYNVNGSGRSNGWAHEAEVVPFAAG